MEQILANALGQDVSKIAAQEKRLLLSRLLARFAHEVRNPLSSIDIHVQLLEEDLAEASTRVRTRTAGRFEVIHGELHRLESVVKQFLSLAGPSNLEVAPVDIRKLVRHVCELLRPEAAARGVSIEMEAGELLPSVSADAAQLTQALVNLAINAIQAMDGGGVAAIRASIEAREQMLCIEVADTGPGIPPGKESAIFDPFFTTKEEGSGLGLWIVQQIASAHAGTIQASNRPEGGVSFVLRIPISGRLGDG